MKNLLKIYERYSKKALSFLIAFFCCGFIVFAQSSTYLNSLVPGEKARLSLLTASPGKDVYSQYGHTGIRYLDPENKLDVVFNYGLFDFNSPNFIWRFVTGETDYMVGTCSFFDFMIEYQMENRSVTEQVLNLRPEERDILLQALLINIRPENRVYRYDFFYNNCATKPRDIIVEAINGTVDYQWEGKYKSLRDEVHFFTDKYRWTQFGIDFALGAEADEAVNLKIQQFAPDVLMESFSKAVIRNDSTGVRPLVSETLYPATIDPELIEETAKYPGPVLVFWTIFVITAILTWLEIRKNKPNHILNSILYTVAGLIGLVIAFLALFSEHPTTDVNYLLLWLHPFYLIYVPALLSRTFRSRLAYILSFINLPLQAFALVGTLFLPQTLHPAMYPFLLTLMLRSLSSYLIYKKIRKNE